MLETDLTSTNYLHSERSKKTVASFFLQLSGEAAPKFPQDGDRHGVGHRHVEAHVAARRPQDHGRDQEGGGLRGSTPGQLQ